jgi:hypothetical protein
MNLMRSTDRLISAAVLILCGLGQIFHVITFTPMVVLIVAGLMFIIEALRW